MFTTLRRITQTTKMLRGLALVAVAAVALTPATRLCAQDGPPDGPPPGMPPGPPPDGGPGGPPPGGPQGEQKVYTLSGSLTAGSGEEKADADKSYSATATDLSVIYAHDGGSISLKNAILQSSGDSSSEANSSFYGLNAAALAAKGGKIALMGGKILTTGDGANGGFANGTGSEVAMKDVFIRASGSGGHGVMATNGGTVALKDVTMETFGPHGAAIATDRGGGTIAAKGGEIVTHGAGSPALYSTGTIVVKDIKMLSTGAEGAVIEGSNSIAIEDSSLEAQQLCGAMLYQSFSGDAQGRQSHFSMRGGSFTATTGPLFWVTNTTGTIELSGVKLSAPSGILVKASEGRWGHKGSNGGNAILHASQQNLSGNLVVGDASSTIEATLTEKSTLQGTIQGASLTLDASSQWVVQADSTLAGLTDAAALQGDSIRNIVGNGHTVTYDAANASNHWLNGKSYTLQGGGKLVPAAK